MFYNKYIVSHLISHNIYDKLVQMSKNKFNTTNVGDKIILLRMNDKFSRIPMGTIGTIKRLVRDPFEDGHHIVDVEWEGESSNLNLLTSEDLWMKVDSEKMNESMEELKGKLVDNDIDVEQLSDYMNKLTDDDITDLFLRNLDRKLLKGGDKVENIRKYLEKYVNSLELRQNITQDPNDDFEVEDEFLYGGVEPEKSKIGRKQYKKELLPLQVELLKLQEHVKKTGKPVVIVFEGRDSAGKGSTIRNMSKYLDPKYFNVIALGIPTPEDRKNWFERYEREIEPGKINFFDRSWYNRGIVEPVMGYGTQEEYQDFMENVNDFEQSLIDKGMELFKFWLSITPQTQEKRFELRKQSPLKYWKFSPNDEKSIEKWDEYTKYKNKVLKQAKEAKPWTVVDTNDKRAGTLNLLRHLLKNIEYEGKDESNFGVAFPEVVTTIKEKELQEDSSKFDKYEQMSPVLSKHTKVIFDFLVKLRNSGVMNMLESSPFMYSGRDYLENYLRFKDYELEDDELEELYDAADMSRNAMVGLAMEYVESKGEEPTIENMNRSLRFLTRQLFNYYVNRV